MKRFLSLFMCVLLAFSFSASVCAAGLKPRLSDMSESECLAYIKKCGVTIPDDNADGATWAGFVKYTIQQVENDPYCTFSYSYSLSYRLAEEIRTVVNNYYGISAVYNKASDALQQANARYVLQLSEPLGSWKWEYLIYNCYSYSIEVTDDWYDPGMIAGITVSNEDILALSFEEQIRRTKADLAALGYHCISDTTICPGYYLKDEGFHAICYRTTVGNVIQKDYHFMRMDEDYWSHKPSATQPLKYKHLPYEIEKGWDNERKIENRMYEGFIFYTSEIRYIKYSIPELQYISYNQHGKYCPGCETYVSTEDCNLGYVYCGSLDIGDFHHLACVECGHIADTYTAACRMTWIQYGLYNGVPSHIGGCAYCGHQISGNPQPCVYSTPGMCDYCG